MRTARRVIVWILLAACCGVQAQDSGAGSSAIDRTLTIVGRDETALPLPPPDAGAMVLPEIGDVDEPWMTPAVTPPPAMLPFPLAVPDPRDVLLDALGR